MGSRFPMLVRFIDSNIINNNSLYSFFHRGKHMEHVRINLTISLASKIVIPLRWHPLVIRTC